MKNIFWGRTLSLILVICMVFSLVGCFSDKGNDIVILYTNDVGCAIDENIGYAGLAAYKKSMQARTPYVSLVDIGNAIQGKYIGTISKGTYIVNMMNRVGYDLAVPGNHEFDYGLEQLSSLIEQSKATYLAANITYKGEGENSLASMKPYKIMKYGNKKVAFIGVVTPKTLTQSLSSQFMEEDVYVYDFKSGSGGTKLYSTIQGYVNECRNKGADYVVVLSHLGDTSDAEPYTSTGLIAATFDVDVVLDGHTGSEISNRLVRNKNGKDVILSSAGSELSNIGKLVISQSGNITTSLVSGYKTKDDSFIQYYTELKATYEETLGQVVGICDKALKITDEQGIRTIKNRETPLGSFCADAYRIVSGSDIAMISADRIQSNLPVSDIHYSDILNIMPAGDSLCKIKCTGQNILDALEIASMTLESESVIDDEPIGESDNFMHVSGLKYTVDTSVEPTVVFDEFGVFKDITGERRVKNVMVLNANGAYTFINPEKVYTLASSSYLIKEGGGGINIFTNKTRVIDGGIPDYQVVLEYLNEHLQGQLSGRYSVLEGRIIVK